MLCKCVCPLDGWVSLHMDELTATPGFSAHIYDLQHMTVSEILGKSSFSASGNLDIILQPVILINPFSSHIRNRIVIVFWE